MASGTQWLGIGWLPPPPFQCIPAPPPPPCTRHCVPNDMCAGPTAGRRTIRRPALRCHIHSPLRRSDAMRPSRPPGLVACTRPPPPRRDAVAQRRPSRPTKRGGPCPILLGMPGEGSRCGDRSVIGPRGRLSSRWLQVRGGEGSVAWAIVSPLPARGGRGHPSAWDSRVFLLPGDRTGPL